MQPLLDYIRFPAPPPLLFLLSSPPKQSVKESFRVKSLVVLLPLAYITEANSMRVLLYL